MRSRLHRNNAIALLLLVILNLIVAAAAKTPFDKRQDDEQCERCPNTGMDCCGGLKCVMMVEFSDEWDCKVVVERTVTTTITRTRAPETHTVTATRKPNVPTPSKTVTAWVTETAGAEPSRRRLGRRQRGPGTFTHTVTRTTTRWVTDEEDTTSTVWRSIIPISTVTEVTTTMTTTIPGLAASAADAATSQEPTESVTVPANNEDDDKGPSAGTIAGAVLGSLIGAGVLLGLILFLLKRRRNQQREQHKMLPDAMMQSVTPTSSLGPDSVHSTSPGPAYGSRVIVTDREKMFGGAAGSFGAVTPPSPAAMSPVSPIDRQQQWTPPVQRTPPEGHRIARKPVPARTNT